MSNVTNALSVSNSNATRSERQADVRPVAIMGILAMLAVTTGCAFAPARDGAERTDGDGSGTAVAVTTTDDVHPEGLSQNGLSQNGLSQNGLSQNGLSQNGLSQNGLSQNGLSQNGLSAAALASSATFARWFEADPTLGDEVMTYVARCAVEAGATLSYASRSGAAYVWQGNLGLAPLWRKGPIALDEQQLVSACLMAHVNGAGRHVAISVRGSAAPLIASTTAAEVDTFRYREGAFYGNVFTEGALHVCSGNAWTQARLYGSTGRVCTLPGNCGFQWDGDCDDLCARRELGAADDKSDSYEVYDRCGAYTSVVTTFLTP